MVGIPDGIPQRELDGETVLYVEEAPFELQEALCRWLLVKSTEPPPGPPTIKGDRPDVDEIRAIMAHSNPVDYVVRLDRDHCPAIAWGTWEAFARWMTKTLSDELARLEG